MVQFRD
ncbi:uncharacterized protein FFE2_03886 [Fusarium fujikuroi]|nr:uncharacterized protein FFE2_03886 [Fusarium fujikuroi]SCN96034.1 uncharacterized protein FFC1_07468 [Fusarium fujikuroi]SCV30583.1 uncharacterized protein FFFS_02356 [Fusarium fujikuroi]